MKKFDYKKWIVENKHGKQPSHSNYESLNEQSPNLRKIIWRTCSSNTGPNQYYCVPAELGEVGSTLTITQNWGNENSYDVYVLQSIVGCQTQYEQEYAPDEEFYGPGGIVGSGGTTYTFDFGPYNGSCPANQINEPDPTPEPDPEPDPEPTGSVPPPPPPPPPPTPTGSFTGSFTGSIGGMPSGAIGKPTGGGNKFPLKRRDGKKPRRRPTRGLREIKDLIKKEINKLKK